MKHDVLEELRAENPVPEVPPPPPFGPLLARLDEEPPVDRQLRPEPRSAWRRAWALGVVLVSAAVVIAVAVALLQAARKPLTTGATPSLRALAPTSPVVPAGGKVAGKGYAYYLKRIMLIATATKGHVPSCSTVTVGGQKVAMLNAGAGDDVHFPTRTVTCSEPAGRAIYVHVWSNMCLTLRNSHFNFGTSGADLVKCANSFDPRVTRSATLDGHPVNLRPLVTATGVFFVPKMLGGPARAAADGVGVLLRGLSKGTHTIQTETPKSPGGGPPKLPALKVHVA